MSKKRFHSVDEYDNKKGLKDLKIDNRKKKMNVKT